MKHGWISGFESGQLSGIKKVFIEAYMNNINLYDRLKKRNENCSVLENINMADLRADSMNEFNKMFREVSSGSNLTNRNRIIVEKYKTLSHINKLKYKKIPKKVLLKYIV